VPIIVPTQVIRHCAKTPERSAWLAALPETICSVQERWDLSLGNPFDHEYVSCAWVAPATRRDGTRTVLKIGMPHMEGEQEIDGLQFWNGEGCVHLLEWDVDLNAMLLERCEPGTPLFTIPEKDQDVVIATMLKRLWRTPPRNKFRPLSTLVDYWRQETLMAARHWPDPGLVTAGLEAMQQLAATANTEVVLVTDLHAGNVLCAQREPWLMIDPKPFVGDAAYDATQHLLNCDSRLQSDPLATVLRIANLLSLDPERIRIWLFARAAAEPRIDWSGSWKLRLARELAP
jgi:streptomycin 6-kinase